MGLCQGCLTTARRGGKGRKVMWKLASVTGTPSVSPKITVEQHRGKENKRGQGTGCKAPHAVFNIGIEGINFLLDTVCSADKEWWGRDMAVQSSWNFLSPDMSWENGTPFCQPPCSPKLLPANLSTTLPRWTRHSQKDPVEPQDLLHARPHLYKRHDSGACASYCHFHQAPATSFAFLCK